jgi:hypothetical protein
MHTPEFSKKVNVEPLLNLLSKDTIEECANYVDEAISWLISGAIETETGFVEQAYNLYYIRDMFLEMLQSSKTGN